MGKQKSLAYYMRQKEMQKAKYGTCRKEEQCEKCHKYKRVKGNKYCEKCAKIVLRKLRKQYHNPW